VEFNPRLTLISSVDFRNPGKEIGKINEREEIYGTLPSADLFSSIIWSRYLLLV
jgi:hypothetical protein